jgi:hypothetical protein
MSQTTDHERQRAAQRALRERIAAHDGHPAPGDLYEHASGGSCRVDVVGITEDTLEPMVGYRSRTCPTATVRPLDHFLARFRLARSARRAEA